MVEGLTLPDDDPILRNLLPLLRPDRPLRLLEIGCSGGRRLEWLGRELGVRCSGIDPSAEAVAEALARGIDAHRGTADSLPFGESAFDVVVFGFCLYLCDRADLFRIAAEADRVLRMPGILVIHDFYSASPTTRVYHHRPELASHKMDFGAMFSWHPDYVLMSRDLANEDGRPAGDDANEWVATWVFHKRTHDDRLGPE